jgi:protein-ribulosamine 3-kinase
MEATPAHRLAQALGANPAHARLHALGRGFGTCARLEIDGSTFFTKRLPHPSSGPLDAEADGLRRLAEPGILRVPEVYGQVDLDGARWLILEWFALEPLSTRASARLGEHLAEHHRTALAELHGLDLDNWIGATPQINTPSNDWTTFLFQHRIGRLVDRLAGAGTVFRPEVTDRLAARWHDEFADDQPLPSLLHGDLWVGNAGLLPDGTPIVFDPAVHYGDRECDLAMAALFGGFGTAFFDAYEATWPLAPGWELRRSFYQLYHVLNHALLFGGHYIETARRRIEGLLEAPC